MKIDTLVLDSEAVDALDSALIEDNWFKDFLLPPAVDKLKRVQVGRVLYLLSKSCDENSKLLIIDLKRIPILSPSERPRYPFERTLRVALHHFRPEVAIPVQWQSFHEDSLVSVYAENIGKQSGQRLYFDQKPKNDCLGHIFAYASEPGFKTFNEVTPNYESYDQALSSFIEAALSEPSSPVDTGNYGLLLSEPLGAQISGAASLADWYERRVTAQQKDFIDRPLDAPVRLRGAAGTGKTQSIAIKCLRELNRFESKQRYARIAVITHSAALAHDVIRGMLFAMDQSESWARFEYAQLWLGTLYQFAQEVLQYERKGLQPLSLDGREGREYQRMLIDSALAEVKARPQFALDQLKSTSEHFKSLLSDDNRAPIIEEIMNEFSSVIDAENIQKGTQEAENYYTTSREVWQLPLNEADRRVMIDIHEVYSRTLQNERYLSMDQMIADFNRYLLTHEWRQLRDKIGFDVVFVDEYHYFNRAESTSLHHILKSGAAVEGKLPLFMAYDLKQGADDVAMTHGTKRTLNFMATKAGRSDLVELTEVFRSTPEIAQFMSDLDGAFPSLDLEGEWKPYGGVSHNESGDKPVLVNYPSDTVLVDKIFAEAKNRALELKDGGRQVAVLCMNEHLFDRYREAGRLKDTFVPLTARDQMNELRYAKRRCVFSMPEYVAGLQFDTVFLIHVDEADFDDRIRGSGYQRRYISRCYVGASRASKRLVIATSHERGGPSRILSGPIASGSLHVLDSKTQSTSPR